MAYPDSERQKSDTQVQWNYSTKYGKSHQVVFGYVPGTRSLWKQKALCRKWAKQPRTFVEDVEQVHTVSRQLSMLRSTVHKVLHENLRLYVYALQPNDRTQGNNLQ